VKRLSRNEIDEAVEESMAFNPKPALTNEQLAALREACKKNGGVPLTDEQREIVLYGKVQQKFSSGIPVV
jgi:hypothetical protein